MKKKQTAVEWLEDKILLWSSVSGSVTYNQMKEYIEQSKVMEKEIKQQIIMNQMLMRDIEMDRVRIVTQS